MRVALTAFITICAAANICVAQWQAPPGTTNPGISDRKIDEYGNIRWEDEKYRLDWLANELEGAPGSILYLFFYDGRRGCIGEARRRAARAVDYLIRVRGVRPGRVIWKYGAYREDLTVEAWLLPLSDQAPTMSPTVDPSEARPRACSRKRVRAGAKP